MNCTEIQERIADLDRHEAMYCSSNPLERRFHKHRLKIIVGLAKKFFSKGKILEVGCGDGFLSRELAENIENARVFGIDLSKKRIERAKRKNGKAVFSVGDATNLRFKDNSFDLTIASEVLEHIPDFKKAVEEIKRVTKKDGKILVSVPNEFNWRLGRLSTVKTPIRTPDHINSFNPKNLEKLFGTKPTESQTIPSLPFVFSLTFIAVYPLNQK